MKGIKARKIEKKQRVFKPAGFTLIEILIAASILSIGMVGAASVLLPSAKALDRTREEIIMKNLAQRRIEEWQSYSYNDILPYMNFRHFSHEVDTNTYVVTFTPVSITVPGTDAVVFRPSMEATPFLDAGYDINVTPEGDAAGVDSVNDLWYAGPVDVDHTPGVISSTITCPAGVSGKLYFVFVDTPTVPGGGGLGREQRFLINDIPRVYFSSATFRVPTVYTYDLRQWDTATGEVYIRVEQTAKDNAPTFGDVNPNAVLSEIRFSVLGGFTEVAYSYQIESTITSTYSMPALVPGWQIDVIVSKLKNPTTLDVDKRYRPVHLVTTISK